jgi:hypothetical protein
MEFSCQEKGKQLQRLAHNQLLFARRNVSSATASLAFLLAAVDSSITCQTPLRFPVSGRDLPKKPLSRACSTPNAAAVKPGALPAHRALNT